MDLDQDIIIGGGGAGGADYSLTYKRRSTDYTPTDNSELNDYNTVWWGHSNNTSGHASA